jgi:thiamine pyrophosphokinase
VEVSDSVKAIIVADGEVPTGAGLEALLGPDPSGASLVIAADGGARKAAEIGLVPDLVMGDGDSLDEAAIAALRSSGTEVELFPAEKDESDTELALREAVARGAKTIVVLGAFGGGRLDHALANIGLLALPELDGRDVVLTDGRVTVRLTGSADGPGRTGVAGSPGDLVSLFPIDAAVEGIATTGLRYPLQGETLRLGPSRGLSNELTVPEARITTERGRLLLVHTTRRTS